MSTVTYTGPCPVCGGDATWTDTAKGVTAAAPTVTCPCFRVPEENPCFVT